MESGLPVNKQNKMRSKLIGCFSDHVGQSMCLLFHDNSDNSFIHNSPFLPVRPIEQPVFAFLIVLFLRILPDNDIRTVVRIFRRAMNASVCNAENKNRLDRIIDVVFRVVVRIPPLLTNEDYHQELFFLLPLLS